MGVDFASFDVYSGNFRERGSHLMATSQNNCNCATEIALLNNEIEHMKRREEDYQKTNERWHNQHEKRLDKLEEADDAFQREATNNEKNKFSIWVTVVVTLGSTLIGAVLTLLFSKF
jgi:chromosome segregation ATPase